MLKFNDGSTFRGNFKENKIEGQGEIKFFNGESFKGSFSKDRANGYGEY